MKSNNPPKGKRKTPYEEKESSGESSAIKKKKFNSGEDFNIEEIRQRLSTIDSFIENKTFNITTFQEFINILDLVGIKFEYLDYFNLDEFSHLKNALQSIINEGKDSSEGTLKDLLNIDDDGYRTPSPSVKRIMPRTPETPMRRTKSESAKVVKGQFNTGGQRGRTEIGPQGEHVSSYTLFEELVYSSCEGFGRSEALKNLHNAFKSLGLNKEYLYEIETITEKFIDDIFDKNQRENVMNIIQLFNEDKVRSKLLESPDLSEFHEDIKNIDTVQDLEKVRNEFRQSNKSAIYNLLDEIMNVYLTKANKIMHASFPKESLPDNPKTGSEKESKNNLRYINQFIILTNNALISEEKDINLKNISKTKDIHSQLLNRKLINEENLNKILSKSITMGNLIFNSNLLEKITENTSNLLYYPRITPKVLLKEDSVKWRKIMKANKYNIGTKPRDNDLEKMYQVTARHIVLTFNAFKGFQYLDTPLPEELIERFIKNYVIKDHYVKDIKVQGWMRELIICEKIDSHENVIKRIIEKIGNKYDATSKLQKAINDPAITDYREIIEEAMESDAIMEVLYTLYINDAYANITNKMAKYASLEEKYCMQQQKAQGHKGNISIKSKF